MSKENGRGRWSAKRKCEAVQRFSRGEALDALSRGLGVGAATLSEWHAAFMAGAEANLKSREPIAEDSENLRLRTLVDDMAMRNELLREKIRVARHILFRDAMGHKHFNRREGRNVPHP